MRYSKIFQYAYIVFAVLFAYDIAIKYINNGEIAYPSILLVALAIFMFFFRQKFNRKLNNKDNSK